MSKVKTTTKAKVKTTKAKAKTTKATAKKKTATTKKATTKVKATTKKKAGPKKAVKPAGPKFKRGYKVTLVDKMLTLAGVTDLYEVYEVSGPKVDKTRIFVDEESVHKFISECERKYTEASALAGKGYQFVKGVMGETNELKAASELPELKSEVESDRTVKVMYSDSE